ncbi:MAG: methyltransferase [Lawsonibacter sp.]|nr:methyltransferase [Lawsonibacter sp.]
MVKTEQLGPYVLSWPSGVFPLGGDALALGEFALVKPGQRVCDLGTGSGVLLLLLARRAERLSLTGIDINPLSARIAQENLEVNRLSGRILCGDLRTAPLPAGGFDLAVSNPPYFPVGSGKSGGPARSEESCSLDELCAAASRLVKNGGRFALCHRPERLADVLCTLRAHSLEPKRLKLVSHGPGHPPSLLLAEAVRQGRPGLVIEP